MRLAEDQQGPLIYLKLFQRQGKNVMPMGGGDDLVAAKQDHVMQQFVDCFIV